MLIARLKRRLHDRRMENTPPAAAGLRGPLESLVGYQLRRASLVMSADLAERLEALSLTTMSLSVLLMIEANPGVTQSELGRELGIKRANMAPLAAQFVERGLIDRRATDGRSHGLHLTTAGRHLAEQAWRSVIANETRFVALLTRDDQRTLNGLLGRLRRQSSSDDANVASPDGMCL
jgi:DNA-binding MarR family transcriptional regulator